LCPQHPDSIVDNLQKRSVQRVAGGIAALSMNAKAGLRGVCLRKFDLRGLDLAGADLAGANLYKADLTGADLQHANFRAAILECANLTAAFLDDANLTAASLKRTLLTNASMLIRSLRMLCLSPARQFRMQISRRRRGALLDHHV
jgi:uncharacterized protein YjbI with pentapeptide repeats